MTNFKQTVAGLMFALLLTTTTLYAEETEDWKHHISIYGWLPSFDGTFKYTIPWNTPGDPDEEAESNALDNLD